MSCLLASDQYWKVYWFRFPIIINFEGLVYRYRLICVVIGPRIFKDYWPIDRVREIIRICPNYRPGYDSRFICLLAGPAIFYEPIMFVSLVVCLVNKCLFTFYVSRFTSVISHVSISCVIHLLFINILAIRHSDIMSLSENLFSGVEFVSWVCFSLGANEYFESVCFTKLIFWCVIECKHSTMIGSFSDNWRY